MEFPSAHVPRKLKGWWYWNWRMNESGVVGRWVAAGESSAWSVGTILKEANGDGSLALLSFLSFFASPCGHQIDADPRAGPDRSSYLIDLGIKSCCRFIFGRPLADIWRINPQYYNNIIITRAKYVVVVTLSDLNYYYILWLSTEYTTE